MPDVTLTLADGTVQRYEDVKVELPDTFVTVVDGDTVTAVHERHVSRVSMTGATQTTRR